MRDRSHSRLLTFEAARLLDAMGGEVKIFDPAGLPLLSSGAVRPTQGKTLAVMQVSGGSQSFNAVNKMRLLGRWMRMLTIPNQSSVAKAFAEFTDEGRMKPCPYYDRVVDVMEKSCSSSRC